MSGLPQKADENSSLYDACDEMRLANIVPLIRPNSFAVKSGVADLSCILCFPPRCPSLAWFRCGVHPPGNVFTAFTRHRARSPVGDVHLFSELTGWRPPARLPPQGFLLQEGPANASGRRCEAMTHADVRFHSRSRPHLFSASPAASAPRYRTLTWLCRSSKVLNGHEPEVS
jgi:hypothetical protein